MGHIFIPRPQQTFQWSAEPQDPTSWGPEPITMPDGWENLPRHEKIAQMQIMAQTLATSEKKPQ
jgi:hypothetical protein